MQKRSFTYKYFIYLALLFVIICGISFVTVKHLEKQFKSHIHSSLHSVLVTVEQASKVFVEERTNFIKAIAKTQNVSSNTKKLTQAKAQNNIVAEQAALKELRTFFKPILESQQAKGFFIINKERISIASMRDQNIDTKNFIEDNFPELMTLAFRGETVITPPLMSDVKLKNQYGVLVQNSITMFLISPIIEANGEINHVLTMRLNPRLHLSKLTSLGRIGNTGETYAFDEQARMLTISRFSEQLRKIHLQPLYGNDYIKLSDPGINLLETSQPLNTNTDQPLTFMAKSATSGESGINLTGYRDYRGVEVLGAWLWMPQFKIGFATEINAEEALLPFHSTVKVFLFTITVTVILCFTMIFIIWQMRLQWQKHTLRLNKALERKVKLRTSHLEKTKVELNKALVTLEKTAATDPLTNLANRRHFDEVYEKEWKHAIRNKNSLAILIFDVDYFKVYNDNYGHLAGDACLVELSEFLIHANIARRPGDVIARYGGEEFIILLSDVKLDYVIQVAETINKGINQLGIPHFNRPDRTKIVTASVGIAYTENLFSMFPNMLIDNADKALYQAKKSGRNTFVLYENESEINDQT